MVDRRTAPIAVAVLLALAGCKPADHAPAAPPTATATSAVVPLPSPTPAPTTAFAALGPYAGKYPFDTIDGVTFLGQPAVKQKVASLVPDADIRALVLGGAGPGTPIAEHGGKLLAWGCETHNCGDHDWTIEIAPDGSAPAVCYHDASTMGDRSRWYLASGHAVMRAGACPSD